MGSLFKVRDFWQARYPDEEFDMRSMAVGNVDNESPAVDKIVLGSFQGNLRILLPKKGGYSAEDLLLEFNVGFPILQLAVGPFAPNVQGNAIAILTPRKLLVGSIRPVKRAGGKPASSPSGAPNEETTEGNELGATDLFARMREFRKEFEHQLERTAYNFCTGTFGGSGRGGNTHQIAVQSMDGQIAIFDHNKHNFARFLPGSSFLCPGAFRYLPSRDAFVVGTSTFEVELYKFSTLASSTASETKEGSQGRKLTPDWSFNVGEDVLDIVVARLTPGLDSSETDVIVVAEHTIFCLKDDGDMRWNRRVEYVPSCIYAYAPAPKKPSLMLIGTHGHSMVVMNNERVLWAARGTTTPVQLALMTVGKTEGMIAALHEDSTVAVHYLGTDPANDPVAVLESKELNYDAVDEEQKRLRVQISQAVNHGRAEPKDQLFIALDVGKVANHDHSVDVSVQLSYRGSGDLEDLVITFGCQDPLMPQRHTIVQPYLSQGHTETLSMKFVIDPSKDRFVPVSLMAEVIVCYTSPSDEQLTAKKSFLLPMSCVGTPVEPVKNTRFELNIATNREQAVPLNHVFQDLTARSNHVTANVLSFQYATGGAHGGPGEVSTVIASTKSGKYKVQSNAFETLWLVGSELVRRLKAHHAAQGETDFAVEFTDPIPLREYFAVIDRHFASRLALAAATQELAELAQQLRAVQKRLLARFREKNPTKITSLELLFEESYRQVYDKAEHITKLQANLATHSNALACATQIVLQVSRYKFIDIMSSDDFDAFRHFLSPAVHNNPTAGWQEMTDAAMVHLLRTVLAKNSRESATAPQPLVMAADTEKLQRHITLVFDRIAKGQGNIAEALAMPPGAKQAGKASKA